MFENVPLQYVSVVFGVNKFAFAHRGTVQNRLQSVHLSQGYVNALQVESECITISNLQSLQPSRSPLITKLKS